MIGDQTELTKYNELEEGRNEESSIHYTLPYASNEPLENILNRILYMVARNDDHIRKITDLNILKESFVNSPTDNNIPQLDIEVQAEQAHDKTVCEKNSELAHWKKQFDQSENRPNIHTITLETYKEIISEVYSRKYKRIKNQIQELPSERIDLTGSFLKNGSSKQIKSDSHRRSRTRSRSRSRSTSSVNNVSNLKDVKTSCCCGSSTIFGPLSLSESRSRSRSSLRSTSKSSKFSSEQSHSSIHKKREYSTSSTDTSYKPNKKMRGKYYKSCTFRPHTSPEIQYQTFSSWSGSTNSKGFSTSSITKSNHQKVTQWNTVIETQHSITAVKFSYIDELTSLKKHLKKKEEYKKISNPVDCESICNDSLNNLDLKVYDSHKKDITNTRPSEDLDHRLYIHPKDAEFVRDRIKNSTVGALQALNELCAKCRWKLPSDKYTSENNLFNCTMKINKCKFSTSQVARQKKLAKEKLVKLILQWFKIMDIS